ncbi:hypothetical protein N431DRAFT_490696 [Stipitochalara longipes BDJ]|nr:hypothetical protein N431DRAFT_490696 [Stipitochalara longipes BDJ]
MESTEKSPEVEKLAQKLLVVSISAGTTGTIETTAKTEEAEKAVQEVLPIKTTLFYVQYPTIYPIFLPQPPREISGRIFIHVVRHAEALHNVRVKSRAERGKQAKNLRETFIHMDNITHILCSPLKSTIQTAQIAFEPLISQGLKIVAYPDLREHGKGSSSTGTSLQELLKLHPKNNRIVDITLVPEDWEINTEDSEHEKLHGIRAKSVRKELWKLAAEALKESEGIWKGHDVSRGSTHKNIEILVVSHGAFLKKMCDQDHMLWNCQYRTYSFDPACVGTWRLRETLESMNRRFRPMWE